MDTTGHALLTVEEMYRADRLTMDGGVPGPVLMDNAGRAVAEAILARWPARPVAVLCGPGNNGGDGFVAARLLAERGWPVRLGLLGSVEALQGDAAGAARLWTGPVEPASPALLDDAPLVVDALFGAGLSRPLDGAAKALVEAMAGLDVVAVDVPSGVHGDTGAVRGVAPRAVLTVTFFRRKPAHLLLPGRLHCGEIAVADIGIPASVLDTIKPRHAANGPGLWVHPWPRLDGHKYHRGHALVLGGGRMTGAARMAARAALRAGAGLVSIACPAEAFPIYAAGSPVLMIHPLDGETTFETVAADPRRNALLVGPGCGAGKMTRQNTLTALATGRSCVVDADSLTSFADDPPALLGALHENCLLTPHDGEFARLFDTTGSKPERTARAAAACGAVVLLKGPDTVIAAPDGRIVINDNAPPDLATAGSGDSLAGFAAGLMAAGLAAFEAACAAAWLHGEAAKEIGPGLIGEDLPDALLPVLRRLKEAGF
jgi:ADP-dependent NAD(P)H-hydrate dehydratase / NAD(P)H-hydrate epimerase